MKLQLSPEEKLALEAQHRNESRSRVCDKIKCILLRSEGWNIGMIAQALRLHKDTVSQYINEYKQDTLLDSNYKGSISKLNEEQSQQLKLHLESNLYEKVIEIIAYVQDTFGITYSISGMTEWLKRNGFSYKYPKGMPAKADIEQQKQFVEEYDKLKQEIPDSEPVLFIDGVHPTMQTKVARGWILKGKKNNMFIATIASRTRLNIMGAIDMATMDAVINNYDTINGESIIDFIQRIKEAYPAAPKIHLFLDQAGYHRSGEVKEKAESLGIELHYLPPYSPNLNPIERLWKFMGERVRNNRVFKSAKDFRETILGFLKDDLPKLKYELFQRITDDFHIEKSGKLIS